MTTIATRSDDTIAPSVRRGLLVLSGYGIRVAVERGHLVVEDGADGVRRFGRFRRAEPGFNRLVVLGHTGTVTLDALRWLRDVGAAFVHVDADARVVAIHGPPGANDVRVRRGQARALENGTGVAVARDLLGAKVSGQAGVCARVPRGSSVVDYLRQVGGALGAATSLADLRYLESSAAAAYWGAWTDLPLPFSNRDRKQVPAHWLRFDSRGSLLTGQQRRASNPANAMLNYLYAILEAEARLALVAVGCDPGMGIVHVDRTSRDSFALDLMEAVRPQVDAFVLNILTTRQLVRSNFFETRDGTCKLMPTLTRPFAETAENWASLVAPFAERAASAFARALQEPNENVVAPHVVTTGRLLRTPLTQTNLRAAQARRATRGPAHGAPIAASVYPARCRHCDVPLAAPDRTYCDKCLATVQKRAAGTRSAVKVTRVTGHSKPGERRPESIAKQWAALTRREDERREWEAAHGPGPGRSTFVKEIAPLLRRVPVAVLIKATGLSRPMCYRIYNGQSVPHVRHWEPIRRAIQEFTATSKFSDATLPDSAFVQQIVPYLAEVPTQAIRAATGFSDAFISRIRRGKSAPHRRHWPTLLALIEKQRTER
jgi:CRISPR-associated endonuclease Cas1